MPVLLGGAGGADGARARLRRAPGRAVAERAARASGPRRHRRDPGARDRGRPLLRRDAPDLQPSERARGVEVRRFAPAPLRRPHRRALLGRSRTADRVLPWHCGARSVGRLAGGRRGHRQPGCVAVRASSRRTPDRPRGVPAAQRTPRHHARRSGGGARGPGLRQRSSPRARSTKPRGTTSRSSRSVRSSRATSTSTRSTSGSCRLRTASASARG